jgi:ubiquinone/menaquinone biosynthesis C-methylase UbiE
LNALENWFCSTRFWQRITQQQLLPWIIAGNPLGDHVLELGAGPGAATDELRHRAPRVTSLEWSHPFAAALAVRYQQQPQIDAASDRERISGGAVLQGDAAALPFAAQSFSSVFAVLMLHHLRSREQQALALREIFRVLRPGGQFFAFEIEDGWFNRMIHIRSVFIPIDRAKIQQQLAAVGFSRTTVNSRRGGFRICSVR